MISVYIVSGPPGSGKSHHANGFAAVMDSEGEEGVIVSADHYFSPSLVATHQELYIGLPFNMVTNDHALKALESYEFDPSKLPMAHQQCMRTFVRMIEGAIEDEQVLSVIVDNTNIHNHEISPYYLVGEALGAKVEILRVEAELDVCIERNTHGVPDEVITRMHNTFSEMVAHPWEDGVMIPKQHMPWWVSRTA